MYCSKRLVQLTGLVTTGGINESSYVRANAKPSEKEHTVRTETPFLSIVDYALIGKGRRSCSWSWNRRAGPDSLRIYKYRLYVSTPCTSIFH